MNMKKIKVMLVDDHAVVRAGYKILLKEEENIKVIAEASLGQEAVILAKENHYDVIVMDISLPDIGGIEAISRIMQDNKRNKILVFSMHEESVYAEQALQAGAMGYMSKSTDPQLLSKAITSIANGKKYIDGELKSRMTYGKKRTEDSQLSDLSTREFEIFCLLAEGLNTNDITKKLNISYKTVANYSTQIKRKLGASTVAEIAKIAIRHNIIKV
ncbi:MAG: response regulator [Gammaproteobacteria bacterium]